MLKPEYSNRFTTIVNAKTEEATLAFYSCTPKLNEDFSSCNDVETFEVSRIIMSVDNLKELQEIINNALEDLSQRTPSSDKRE